MTRMLGRTHLIAIAHVEDLTESSVLNDDETGAGPEGAEVGIEDDGGGHGVIVLGKRSHVNDAAIARPVSTLSTPLTF